MPDSPTSEYARRRSPKRLAAIAIVAFIAFPGTLTATASGLVILYASPPALGMPELTTAVAALAVCTVVTFLAHHTLR
jgi:hypothetical protein